jgi:hypothetical protein
MRITSVIVWFVFAAGLLPTQLVYAQYGPPGRISASASPEHVLRELVAQIQTGTPDASFIGPQLWQMIAAQTNNSGIYPALVQLGKIDKVEVIARRDLPAGPLYSLRATHGRGEATWLLGISNYSHKVEYASFGVNSAPQPLPPQPAPTEPSSTSDACEKFPNLCRP